MKKDGKYRFNLGFPASSVEEIRAGELLESLGLKKSVVVVAALNEYMENHPELQTGSNTLHISLSAVPKGYLEDTIRRMIEERLSGVEFPQSAISHEADPDEVSTDIMDMLSDLDCFK